MTTGLNAAAFTQTWRDGVVRHPSFGEVVAYLDHHQAARGGRFSPAELRGAGAAAVCMLAYQARCEGSGGAGVAGLSPRWAALA